jgi:hypothetical protein
MLLIMASLELWLQHMYCYAAYYFLLVDTTMNRNKLWEDSSHKSTKQSEPTMRVFPVQHAYVGEQGEGS